jgi:hypothetical protein
MRSFFPLMMVLFGLFMNTTNDIEEQLIQLRAVRASHAVHSTLERAYLDTSEVVAAQPLLSILRAGYSGAAGADGCPVATCASE